MTSFAKLAELPLTIDSYELSGQQADVSSGFLRMTTTINFSGGGERGRGEDVTYDNEDHEALQAWGAPLALAGEWTLGSFCEALEAFDLFPQTPVREISRNYRIWGFESAALDLALRQAGQSLHQRLGLTPKPLRFVCSLRLGEAPAILAPLEQRLSCIQTWSSSSTQRPNGTRQRCRPSRTAAAQQYSTSKDFMRERKLTRQPTRSSTSAC